jgi:prepilin-type N-terminal cleavage/methylation domain-containing protein
MRRRAFTLLEVILALALAAVVLGLLAMAVEIHLRVADKSRFRVEEAQLARTLLERIAEDLRNAVPCSQSSSSGGCLLGNGRELQVDISHLPRTERPVGLLVGDSPPLAARLSDARTVTYALAGDGLSDGSATRPTGAAAASANTNGGLIRRELERAAFTFAGQQGLGDELEQATELLAPEVTDLQFSYFDGSTTYDEWDSTSQGRLPAAVRVAISIRPAPDRSKTLLGLAEDRLPAVYEITIPLINARAVDQETSASSSTSDTSGKQSDTAASGSSDDKEKQTGSDRQTVGNSGKKSGDNGKGRTSGNRGKRSGRGGGRSNGGGPGPAPGEKPPGPGRPPGFGPPPGPARGPVAPGPAPLGPTPLGPAPPGPRSPAPNSGPRSITPRGK